MILLPTAYFPPVSYFLDMTEYKQVFIEQMETFPKQTFRNRCEIMTSSGKLSLIVPVTKPNGNHTMTKDIEICYREPWQKHHWKTIQTAYRSSPYFRYYEEIIQAVFVNQERLLIEMNDKILGILKKILGINMSWVFTQEYLRDFQGIIDQRLVYKPGKRIVSENFPEYPQVFSYKSGFIKDLSILDLVFNLGPDSTGYLFQCLQITTNK
jgi:hypothetical protein